MKCLFVFGAMFLTGMVIAAETSPATPPAPTLSPEALKAIDLVRDLADARYKVRELAAKELKKLGRHAKPALLDGMKSSDPEVWNRCAQLLPEVMAADLKARVDGFLADTEGKLKHDLPMMESFQKIAGNDIASRKLFVDMVKTNANFLEACEQNPKLAGEKYNVRAQELQQQLWGPWSGMGARPQLIASDVAALFLVGADPEMSKGITTTNNVNVVSNFLWQQPFQNALRSGEQAVAFRKVFFAWAELRTDVNSVSQTLSVIQNLNLKEGLEFAVRTMKSKDQQIWTRAQAMTCVGKMGDKTHLPSMEAMFEDKTQVTNIQWNNVNISTQLNDIALAMAIHLSGQAHKDYEFDALKTQPGLLWAYHYLGFSAEDKRIAAFKRYADWQAAQKKK